MSLALHYSMEMYITAQGPVSEMTYIVSSGMLNSTIPYHTWLQCNISPTAAFPSTVHHCSTHWPVPNSGCPLFFIIDSPWLFHDQKNENPWPIGTTYISNERYMTYECITELVVRVVTFTELFSAVVKFPW